MERGGSTPSGAGKHALPPREIGKRREHSAKRCGTLSQPSLFQLFALLAGFGFASRWCRKSECCSGWRLNPEAPSMHHGLRLRQGQGEDARSTLHHHPRQRRGLKPLLLLMMCPISSYPSPSCPAKFLPSPSRCVLHREGLALVYIVHPIAVFAFTRVVLLVCDKPYRRRRRSNICLCNVSAPNLPHLA